MEKNKRQGRDATFWKILNAALELDFRKGHLKWTMSDLSRKSGITRSLIYYHFGRSKVAILEEATRVIGEEFIGVTEQRISLWQRGEWAASVRQAREIIAQAPYLGNFYLNLRDKPTEIGATLRKLENSYLKKLEVLFPDVPAAGVRALFALFFGMVFSPHVDDASVEFAITELKKITVTPEASSRMRVGTLSK